jgi:ubiquinone/menaquinone biosynthesis C-methylase UbiE
MRAAQEKLVQKVLGLSLLNPRSRILEVFCGSGGDLNVMRELTGASVFGLDPSFEGLREKKQKDQNLNLLCAVSEALPFTREVFDLVYMIDVIRFLSARGRSASGGKDWQLSLREILRVLKDRGEVCIVSGSEPQTEEEFLGRYFPSVVKAKRRRRPGAYRLSQVLKSAGFRNLTTQSWEGEILSGVGFLHSVESRTRPELALVPEEEFREGLDRLKPEVEPGSLFRVLRYTLVRGRK